QNGGRWHRRGGFRADFTDDFIVYGVLDANRNNNFSRFTVDQLFFYVSKEADINGLIKVLFCLINISKSRCAKHHSEYWKRRGVPAPEANYIFGNVLQMQRKGFKQYDLENMKKYGGYWGGMFLNYPMLDICDLDMLRKVLIKDFGTFQNRMMDDFFAGSSPIRLHMLNTLKDAHWKNVRNIITPAFTTGRIKKRQILQMIPIMSRCIDETEAIINEAIVSSNSIIDVKRSVFRYFLFSNMGMDIIAQVAFGVVLSTQRDTSSDFTRYAKKLFDVSLVDFPLLLMALFPNVTRFVEKNFNYQFVGNQCDTFFEELLRKIVKERRSNPRKFAYFYKDSIKFWLIWSSLGSLLRPFIREELWPLQGVMKRTMAIMRLPTTLSVTLKKYA
ncbi:unnamed protein product, partial [Anisakis simplex]|uniref:Probable cytochrome P450 310a1 (inferred by orthology to a D. melanogaster protein) n=1 Tax=Anisakis simplex TaxID=6269 RepID=A0A0M3KC82_ANISI